MSFGLKANRSNRSNRSNMTGLKRKPIKRFKTKKLKIKAFKKQPKLSDTFEHETIEKLLSAVKDIHSKRAGHYSFEELYKSCQQLCTLKRGKIICDKLYAICDAHIADLVSKNIKINSQHPQTFLLPIKGLWLDHREEMNAIRQVFLMLDRTYIRQDTDIKSLWAMGIHLLKKHINDSSKFEAQRNCNTIGEQDIVEDKNNEDIDIVQVPSEPGAKSDCNRGRGRGRGRGGGGGAFESIDVQQLMVTNVLQLIESERNGEEIDKSLMQTIIIMMAHLDMYKKRFETQLLAESKTYYSIESQKLIHSLSVPKYLSRVIQRTKQEHDRVMQYLLQDVNTQRGLTNVIEQQMIQNHSTFLLTKGFVLMMDEQPLRTNDLRHLYQLLQRVHQLEPLKTHLMNYITTRGTDIVKDSSQDKIMVKSLLNFKLKLDGTLSQSFDGNPQFRHIVRRAWEKFLNSRQNKPAELMAKYVDLQLRTGARGTSEQELEETLDRVMDIFRFIRGKDVFQAFYKKDLAKRLLLNTSASEDAEKNMINRIRKECGQAYTSNLEKMFKDMDISLDLNEKFRRHLLNPQILFKPKSSKDFEKGSSSSSSSSSPLSSAKKALFAKFSKISSESEINTNTTSTQTQTQTQTQEIKNQAVNMNDVDVDVDIDIQVLTSGCWPSYDTEPIILPSVIQQQLDSYRKFYVCINSGRKLKWTASLSHCVVAANFPKGRKELVLSAYQATVLMLFNKQNKMTFQEILSQSKIKKNACKNTLLSLVKGHILKKKTSGIEISDDSMFKLNKNYENRLRRVKVNQIQIVETVAEQKKTSVRIFKDRQYQIDACVVRIMKARKTLKHQQLMAQCLKQLRFEAQPRQIKKRIQNLIENEYMERDENDHSLYHYKA